MAAPMHKTHKYNLWYFVTRRVAAEAVVLTEFSTGAADDLAKGTDIAQALKPEKTSTINSA